MVHIAPVKWAQRSDSIYVTICLPDVTEEKIDLDAEHLAFKGKSGGQEYECKLEFLRKIKKEGSVWKVLPRSIQILLKKEDEDTGFWERLLKDKQLEKTNVKIDWDRYVDEDEEEENPTFDTSQLEGGMDFSQMMGGAGGMGGMGGMGGLAGMMGGGMGGMGMGGMGGLGGMGAGEEGDYAEDEDSDDDELPDLENDEEGEGK